MNYLLKLIVCFLGLVIAASTLPAGSGKSTHLSAIQWKSNDCSRPLMLPEGHYDASQFGKGKYRIDNKFSVGHFNNIYIIFQATNSLDPASVPGALESTFNVKNQKVTWRSFKTVVEGRSVIRKEALMPNILPHEKKGNDSEYIWIRIDADTQEILDQISPAAESILQDAS